MKIYYISNTDDDYETFLADCTFYASEDLAQLYLQDLIAAAKTNHEFQEARAKERWEHEKEVWDQTEAWCEKGDKTYKAKDIFPYFNQEYTPHPFEHHYSLKTIEVVE